MEQKKIPMWGSCEWAAGYVVEERSAQEVDGLVAQLDLLLERQDASIIFESISM